MGTYKPTFTGAAYHDTKRINLRMTSYSYSYTSSSSRSSRSSSCEEDSRSIRATSELSDKLYKSLNTDRYRFQREFYTPEPISRTGHYYPRYRITGDMETGSPHVSYLARPYYCYKIPSRYGYSKFITVRKLSHYLWCFL